jgi:predicted transcriptional regulator
VNYEGACVIAAHQYLKMLGDNGYMDENGKIRSHRRADLTSLGDKVIEKWINF